MERNRSRAGCFLEDFDAAAGADACGAGRHHFLEIGQRTDAAGGFDAATVRFHQPAHERNVANSRAAGAEAGGGFDEVGTAGQAKFAGASLFGIGEQAGFKNDFAECTSGVTDFDDGLDVSKDGGVVAGFERADVDNHVNLAGAIAEGGTRFGGFGFGEVGAEREPDDGADFDRRGAHQCGGKTDVKWVDADGTEVMLHRFLAQSFDVGGGGVGLEERVVNQTGNVHHSRQRKRSRALIQHDFGLYFRPGCVKLGATRRGRGSKEAGTKWQWVLFTERIAEARQVGDAGDHESYHPQRPRHAPSFVAGGTAAVFLQPSPVSALFVLFVGVELFDAVEDVPDARDKGAQAGGVQWPFDGWRMNL